MGVLVIRNEQFAAFDFEQGLVGLAGSYPEVLAELGWDAFEARVRAGHARAVEHGFSDRGHWVRFLHLGFLLGEEFEGEPWAAGILGWTSEPGFKLAALEHAGSKRALRQEA